MVLDWLMRWFLFLLMLIGKPPIMNSQSNLSVEVRLPERPIYLSRPYMVELRLINTGQVRLLINGRLAVGYRNNLSRELFADLLDPVSGRQAKIVEVDYNRDFSPLADYIFLESGQSVSGSFDLIKWYAPVKAGTYRLVVHYQADEPLASTPQGVVCGVYSSEPIDLLILQCKEIHP